MDEAYRAPGRPPLTGWKVPAVCDDVW